MANNHLPLYAKYYSLLSFLQSRSKAVFGILLCTEKNKLLFVSNDKI